MADPGETPPAELVPLVVERVRAKVAADAIELDTFHVGVQVTSAHLVREGRVDWWKNEVKRAATRALLEGWPGRRVDPVRPDAVFVFDANRGTLEARLATIHVYGRYRKLSRDLPQTRWFCLSCRGRGCEQCGGAGLAHPSSVEALTGEPLRLRFRADEAVFHGLGREDRDVRALGDGRPFVVELVTPRRRAVDLEEAARAIDHPGLVELARPLRVVDAGAVARMKTAEPPKRYRALVALEAPVSTARIDEALAALRGAAVEQRTPGRVAHRRSDLVRPRRVLAIDRARPFEREHEHEVEVTLLVEAGTYVKELVSGDEGRTTPSLAALLGVGARVEELDVLEVLVADEALVA